MHHTYTYTYTHTLVALSAEIVIFEKRTLRQYYSNDFDLLDSSRSRHFAIVNECAHIVKDSNV